MSEEIYLGEVDIRRLEDLRNSLDELILSSIENTKAINLLIKKLEEIKCG